MISSGSNPLPQTYPYATYEVIRSVYVKFPLPIRPFLTSTPPGVAFVSPRTLCGCVYVCVCTHTDKCYPVCALRYARVYASRVHSIWEHRHIRRICASPLPFFGVWPGLPPLHFLAGSYRFFATSSLSLVLTCHHMTLFFLRPMLRLHDTLNVLPVQILTKVASLPERKAFRVKRNEENERFIRSRAGNAIVYMYLDEICTVRARKLRLFFKRNYINPYFNSV